MTPNEKNVLKSLIVVAWADGTVKEPEQGLLDGLMWAFGASDEEEQELRDWGSKKRKLDEDLPVSELSPEDKELLLAHAALMCHADGKQTKAETKVLSSLIELLGYDDESAKPILDTARERAGKLASRL